MLGGGEVSFLYSGFLEDLTSPFHSASTESLVASWRMLGQEQARFSQAQSGLEPAGRVFSKGERTVPSSPPHSSTQRKQIPSILSRGSSNLNATLEPQGGAGTVLRDRTPLYTKSVIPLPGLSFFINYMGLKEETFL